MNKFINNLDKNQSYFKVPEFVIRQFLHDCKDEDKINEYQTIIKSYNEFVAAEMTPIFLINEAYTDIRVIVMETFNKKLH